MSPLDSSSRALPYGPATTIGPVFIGNILNWMLLGTLIMQTYRYYRLFPQDRLATQILVGTVFCLDFAQTLILTHDGWWFIVINWGEPLSSLRTVPWSGLMIPLFSGAVAGIVQIFYAWRIWTLSESRTLSINQSGVLYALSILIVLTALLQGISGIFASAILLAHLSPSSMLHFVPAFSTSLVASLITDVLIAGCMTYILYSVKASTSSSDSECILTRLIHNTIQTGALTVVCACVELILYINPMTQTVYLVPAYILGKLYTNSLMLTLNLRR